MNKKKILIVCSGFYPDNSPRAHRAAELVKEFSRQGHEVTVLTPKKPVHLAFEKEHQVQIKDLGKPKWKVPDFGGSKLGYILTRMAVRSLQLGFEYPGIELMFKVTKALLKEKDYDLLISIAVPFPIHWGVAKVWNKNQSIANTWVADCGDPYMGDTNDSFRKLFYFKYVEKWFCRKADYISVPRIEMKVSYYPEFHQKIIEIPQGFSFEEVNFEGNEPQNPVPTFAFAGGLFKGKRDPSKFMEFLCSLNFDFKFIIYTKTPDLIVPYKEKLGDKLEIRNYIPREELLPVLNKMDFLINIGYDPALQSPSKLIDYHLAGRPILSFNSDFNEKDVQSFEYFLKRDYSSQLIFGNIEKFNISNVAKQFTALK
ncbi:MAG: glycosyltransferase [Bacteroidales bacterium]|nr:glycosyltransferase [Bacteroidales bacterium]